ncbi:MAG: DUF1428 domain-containing protein [Salipiger thiooxidans]|jgi:uncharacterized protein YbaA (DUF1428 family)|uniref:DUF1428 domain-containing protein n=1 Tax=Salipiger thiooxidans TaxID=282683 RepID=UPI001A8D5390|nr:DUF1428 domain-containing protein [Salipiger thiooxidans]MBN8187075.1 DUF1428 domain-containing protein [Salipiger thiooxidans]MBR9838125.1 DUF1428 domain-containing protein [Paracoccaceae bacterium]
MSYVSGFLTPVPGKNKDAYLASAQKSWPLFKDYGATAMRECWEADVPDGEVTSFPMAVKREDGEAVVFSWILWPDKATADACWASMDTDPRWREMDMPFDGKRMIYGNFETLFEA